MKVTGDVAKHSMTVAADAASQAADQSHEAGIQAVDHAHDLKKQDCRERSMRRWLRKVSRSS
jgi:hypothetical protein